MVTLNQSLKLFEAESLSVVRQSHWYGSAAFPAGAGPDYVNGVVEIRTQLDAPEVLAALHRIEAVTGRTRSVRWGSRVCDLDLLAFEDNVSPDLAGFRHWFELSLAMQKTATPAQLILPHPRLQDRAFVLLPFRDVAPEWRHPVLGKTVAEMLANLPKPMIATVQKISGH